MRRFCYVAVILLLFGTAVAQEREPQSAEDYYDRGGTRYDRRDYDGAIADYTKAIALNPSDAEAYFNRALARYDKGEVDSAIADYTKAIALNPNDADAYYRRGLARDRKGDWNSATADLTKAIALDPGNGDFYHDRGLFRQKNGDLNGAIADYTKTVALGDRSGKGYNQLAWLLATTPKREFRNGKLAVEYARKAVWLTREQEPNYLDTLAAAYAEAGDFQQAVAWQNKALEFPNFVKADGEGARQRLELYSKHQPYTDN